MAKSNTKDRLIDTAIEMVWKNSYSSVSVDDICKAADVRKGSFYHHFKSKADLAIEAMEAHYQASKIDFDTAFSPSLAPLERFDRMVDMVCEKQQKAAKEYGHVCGCPFATLGSEMAGQEDLIRSKADDVFRRFSRYYESAIRDLVAEGLLPGDTDVMARTEEISSHVCGQVIMARVQNSLEPLGRDLKTGIYRLLGIDSSKL
jgi:TetR/AcrR family transcriptional repressor of nem operon